MSDLVQLFSSGQFTLETRRAERAGKVHAGLSSSPEWVVREHSDWRTLLSVEGGGEGSVPAAALDTMVGSVSDVVVYELTHLHHQDRVVGVRLVVAHGQSVADLPG